MLLQKELSITEYLSNTFTCECGNEHSAAIKHIAIEDDALSSLIPYIKANSFTKAFVLYDTTTYKIAGDLVSKLFTQENQAFSYYIINTAEPVPDEHTIGEVLIHYDPSCDLIIGVGSGTINDLSRFISFKLGIDYIIIATALSMDGFASNVAPLIVNHMKTTYEAHAPYAIFGDTRILHTAPMNMIAAGIGDILGKYTCLCDWKIAHIITGEFYCSSVADIVKSALETVIANISGVGQMSNEAVQAVMNALIQSGIAMSFAGNSRPASGSEHHLSHYWEMMYLFKGKKPVLHGTKVGIGTIAVIKAYELLMSQAIDFDKARSDAANFNMAEWEAHMKEAYLSAAESVISLEKQVGKNTPENVIPRINLLEKNWSQLLQIVEQLPSADTIRCYLRDMGAPDSPITIGIDKDLFINSFIAAKELRNRFGLLQILFDLGVTKEIAEQVWDYF